MIGIVINRPGSDRPIQSGPSIDRGDRSSFLLRWCHLYNHVTTYIMPQRTVIFMRAADTSTTATAGLLEQYLASPGLLLALLGVEAMRRLRGALENDGLTPRQFQLLGLLHDRGPLGQQDLGREVGVAPSVLVTLLNPLEADGFVRRERDTADRRRHLVVLTSKGASHLAHVATAQRAAEADLFAMFDETQRQQMSALLALMHDGLAADDATDTDAAGGPSTALERAALLVADADRRRASQPADPGGVI